MTPRRRRRRRPTPAVSRGAVPAIDVGDIKPRAGRRAAKGPLIADEQRRDGSPMASYGIWDVTNETFEFRRVKYDIKGAQRAIRKARLPERFALRLETGR